MPRTALGSARTYLTQDDFNYVNRALKDLCNAYKATRDFKVKSADGGNFYAIPHRVGSGITDRFGGEPWPYWYATVALNSPNSQGVGKRRLLIRIRNHGDYGTADQLIYSPTHYGDSAKKDVADFIFLTDVVLSVNVGFAYKGSLTPVAMPAAPPAPARAPAPAAAPVLPPVALAVVPPPAPTITVPPPNDPENFVPDFVKELRRLTGDSYFSAPPEQFLFGRT